MDIYQIIITYYPIWSPFEWIIFLSVLALAVCIAVVLYKKQKITMRQSIAGILLLLYLLLVFGSTVFTRMPGERQYQLEVFWSWKKILHYIEQHGMVTGTGLLREFALCETEALRDENGAPYFSFSGRAAALMQARGLTAHLSLTHEGGTAAAFVVLERREASASLKEEPECSTLR